MNDARTFYIDDVLYTASQGFLKMNSFEDLNEINSIKLENTGKFIDYLEEPAMESEMQPVR
ncbi:copper amine oxidase-like protein [Candidatus Nitrosopumilus koreensis AR1]|uniref:Copper amine oxidase-like protein n=2 Tax=Nitrosopumilus TaxID=338191 RepID=K0B5P5_9ARCH|nr:copper amine oxidase-like protein [Candidatus Nitrosopumilus koreensis AR1]